MQRNLNFLMILAATAVILSLVVSLQNGLLKGLEHSNDFSIEKIEQPEATKSFITDIKTIDINSDGWEDFVVAKSTISKKNLEAMGYTASLHGDHAEASDDHDDDDDNEAAEFVGANEIDIYLNMKGEYFSKVVLQIPNNLGSPGQITIQDFDEDNDPDILVGILGQLSPSIEKKGSVVIFENVGKGLNREWFTPHAVEEESYRVAAVFAKDLDKDGDKDLAVAAFGGNTWGENAILLGDIHWLENTGDWKFIVRGISDLDGSLAIVDITDDLDAEYPVIAFLVSQDHESIVLANFLDPDNVTIKELYKIENDDWGSNRLVPADLDSDGDNDLIWVNGDSDDAKTTKEWHGVRWLENSKQGYVLREIGKLPGAYQGIPIDMDLDSDIDIVATKFIVADYEEKPTTVGIYENDGNGNFGPLTHVYANASGVIAMTSGDFDNDGDNDLIFQDLSTLELLLARNNR